MGNVTERATHETLDRRTLDDYIELTPFTKHEVMRFFQDSTN